MKSLWAAWLIYYSDIKGKFNIKAFDTLSRLEKYFYVFAMQIYCWAIVPFCINRLSEAGFGYRHANHLHYEFHLWFN